MNQTVLLISIQKATPAEQATATPGRAPVTEQEGPAILMSAVEEADMAEPEATAGCPPQAELPTAQYPNQLTWALAEARVSIALHGPREALEEVHSS